ncbi:MAG: DUF5320 domain-containing protein, partial [Deltaproteobacteria bacterium]|nr:DUF5320 domain-containing protein [Deltaproteobacteria bacterium]
DQGRFKMPRGDGTGPKAMGSMTGRGAGNCAGSRNRGNARDASGRGTAGRGMCNWFKASDLADNSALETENRLLMQQADALRRELDEIDGRLKELKKKN